MIKSKHAIATLFMAGFVFITLSGFNHAQAAEDEMSLNSKMLLAQDFFEIRPVSELADNAIAALSEAKPPEERALFVRQMRVHMDYAMLESKMSEALISTYTPDEIKAMIAFYGSELGKSITEKQPAFERAVSPVLQQMLDKAFTTANYGDNGL